MYHVMMLSLEHCRSFLLQKQVATFDFENDKNRKKKLCMFTLTCKFSIFDNFSGCGAGILQFYLGLVFCKSILPIRDVLLCLTAHVHDTLRHLLIIIRKLSYQIPVLSKRGSEQKRLVV